VELITGLAFAFLYWHFGLNGELGMAIVYACFLIVIFFIDLERQLILNKVVYPGILMAFVFSFLWPDHGVVDSLIGGAVGCAILLVPYLIYPKGMGLGDVKLALMAGLMTAYPEAVVALILAIFAGGLVGVVLLALRLKGMKGAIPFGTFLAVAAMAALLWGETIREWYVDRFWG
jgi:prepilin signal peptidase PulO-like enzyme (type II secretory pathway)